MNHTFCPNLSLPENQARIQEIGLENFYKEYYQNNFNINPEQKSVLDTLFVDIDNFSDSMQNQIIDSIIYQIEEEQKLGVTNVNDIFNNIREAFQGQNQDFIDANDDGSLDRYIQVFNNIDANWDRFKEFTIRKLAGIGVRLSSNNKQTTEEVSYDVDLQQDTELSNQNIVDTNTFVETESSYQRDNYDDGFVFSQSTKDTASAHLKLVLSKIPEVEFVNGELSISENFLGLPQFMSLDKVWNNLLRELTPLTQYEIVPRIEELAQSNPMYAAVYDSIFKDSDPSIQNEFIVTFSNQQANFKTARITKADTNNNRTIEIFGTNRQNADDIILTDWSNNLKSSPIVSQEAGEYIINTTNSKDLLEKYNTLASNFDSTNNRHKEALDSLLKLAGINLSSVALDNFVTNGIKIGKENKTAKQFLNENLSLVYSRLAGNQIEDASLEVPFEKNNPYISESTTLRYLANIELDSNPFLYEGSFISGDGKAKYSYVKNSYLSKLFKSFRTDNGLNKLRDIQKTAYAQDSIWINKLLNDPKFIQSFSLDYLDTLTSDATTQTGKPFKSMSTKEKEFTRISLFQNQGRINNSTAVFLGLIPSDKTTLPLITANKTKVVYNNGQFNRETVNALYGVFLSEYKRIQDVITQENNPNITKIKGYHNGMGKKFLIYDFFNSDNTIWDDNGNLRPLDQIDLKNNVTAKITNFINKSIRNQIKYWDNLGITIDIMFDKTYRSNLGTFNSGDEYKEAFAADYVVNYFLANVNYTQLIGGDPALAGKKSIKATWDNYSKRLAKDIAPGLDGNFTNPYYKTLFLQDLEWSSKHLNEYKQVLGSDKIKAYNKINPADAQEYTTLREHLAVMKAYGKLTPELEAAGNRLLEGGADIEDIKLILQPMKPVQVGSIVDPATNTNQFFYIKTSSFPLVPALTAGLEIDKLRVFMESNEIDRAVYESGVKLGLQGDIQSLVDDQGNFISNLVDNAITLERDLFRIQQEVPYHGDHDTINEGSQARKLILLDVADNDNLTLFNKEFSGKEAKNLYEQLHVEKINRAMNKFISDIGAIKESNGNIRIDDLSKLQSILMEEATSRNYNINDIYGLQLVTDANGKSQFKIPLAFNTSSNRLESILNALVTNRVIKQELTGFAKIQGSGVGFSRLSNLENSPINNNDIIWLNNSDTELNYIRKSADGKTLLQADILVPSWFKDNSGNMINIKNYVTENGNLDTERIPEDLLTVIGIRIPTQGYNSIMSFKVKGFLPAYMGDLAIVPGEVTAQMGSDFDVDKMFIYRYEYNVNKDGYYSKIEPAIDNLNNASDKAINNSIIQFYEDRYKDPSLLEKILEPNGFGKLPALSTEIATSLGLNKTDNFLLPTAQNLIHKNNNDGKAGVGIFSLFSTFIRSAQDAQLTVNNDYAVKFIINGIEHTLNDLAARGFTQSPSTTIQFLQSAAVDNAKEQILGNLNINTSTMDVAGTMALLGLDEEFIAYFLSQPVIREYADLMSNINDITNPVYQSNPEAAVIDSLFIKYRGDNNKVLSLDDLKADLTNPTIQNIVLANFVTLKDLAKSIRSIQAAINVDTKGLGSRFSNLQVKSQQITNVTNSEVIAGVDRLFSDSTIEAATEALNQAKSLYGNILPYDTDAYVNVSNKVQELMGKADGELSVNDLNAINSSIKSYIYSDSNLLENIDANVVRNQLLFDNANNKSLGTRWEEYIQSPAGKKNLLAERIKVRRGNNATDPIFLEAINTPAANSTDNNTAIAAFYNMFIRGNEIEQQLAKDLTTYFIVTGGNNSPTSIGKYIPFDILESNNFSYKLRELNNGFYDGTTDISLAVEQYFQHNPSKALPFKFDNGSVMVLQKDGVTPNKFMINPDSGFNIPVFNEYGRKAYSYPTYMSTYDEPNKRWLLYKLAESDKAKAIFTRITTLGDSRILEYNFNNRQNNSLIGKNNSPLLIPNSANTINSVEEEIPYNVESNSNLLSKTPKDLNWINSQLDFSNSTSFLNSILNTTSNSSIKRAIGDIMRIMSEGEINVNLDIIDQRFTGGQYTPRTNTVSINPSLFLNYRNPIEEISRTAVHEYLHALTYWKLNISESYLRPEELSAKKGIQALFNEYRDKANQEDLARFIELNEKLRNPETSEEDIRWYFSKRPELYSLLNLDEFIADGLTKPEFFTKLKNEGFWNRLWQFISDLLGLNKRYKDDYERLYSETINLIQGGPQVGGYFRQIEGIDPFNTEYSDEANRLEFVRQRDRFLTNYKTSIGKRITDATLKRFKESAAKNGYDRLNITTWNGELRIGRKDPITLFSIMPEVEAQMDRVEKELSPEQKFADATLKRLYGLLNKFKSSEGAKTNVIIQQKIATLEDQIKKIEDNESATAIIDDIKDRLASIKSKIESDDLLNVYDVEEFNRYLGFYRDLDDFITFDEAFDEYNQDIKSIMRQSRELIDQLTAKKLDIVTNYFNSNLDIKSDPRDILSSPTRDVGEAEALFQSGAVSSSQAVQLIQAAVEQSQLAANIEYTEYESSVKQLIEAYVQKHGGNYDMFLQRDKLGNLTGRLLNKYSQSYYDELIKLKDNKKARAKFYYENTKVTISEEGKKQWERDLDIIKEINPLWDQVGTIDNANYEAFMFNNDPYTYIENFKNRVSNNNLYNAQKYITETPTDNWIDPEYTKLMQYAEDSPERMLYDLLSVEFKHLNKKYNNQVNFIPEFSKSWLDQLIDSNLKGGVNKLKEDLIGSVYKTVQPNVTDRDLDLDGRPFDSIPVYHMQDTLNPNDKSYDLGRVLLLIKQQEIVNKHKSAVEPYLQISKELISNLPEYVVNKQSGEVVVDENNEPLLNTAVNRNKNINQQVSFILDDYLYNKGVEQSGAFKKFKRTITTVNSKGEEIVTTQVLTGSAIGDSINALTRAKGMALNLFSGVGNLTWGVLSNFINSANRTNFSEKTMLRAFGTMLNASIPGSREYKKVGKLMKYFDVLRNVSDLKFGKLHVKTNRNPLSNVNLYFLQEYGEKFVQGQNAMALLMYKKINDLSGKEYSLYDAFDDNGEWNTAKFGENPYNDLKNRLNIIKEISDAKAEAHGDYDRSLQIKKGVLGRMLMVFRTWIPQSIATRFGREYTDLQGNTKKGRYRSLKANHALIIPLIKDIYKAFNTSQELDTVDTRNLRQLGFELTTLMLLYGLGLLLKMMIDDLDDDEKEPYLFALNNTIKMQGDLTFFFNPYAFESTIREPIPAFKTAMDAMDVGLAVGDLVLGEDEYQSGFRKGRSKFYTKLKKAFPIVNQPDKLEAIISDQLD